MIDAPHPLISDVLRLNGRWRRNQPALRCNDASLSWGEFDARTEQVANALATSGIGRGDAVAIVMNNSLETVEAMFGTIKAGACVVPINLSVSDEGLERMLVDAAVRAVIATPQQRERLQAMRPRVSAVASERWICLGGGQDWTDYARWRDAAPITRCAAEPQEDDPCNIIYSSGTTALPKGIVHSQRRRLEWAYDVGMALRYHSGMVAVCPVGLFSNISWIAMLGAVLNGGSMVVMDHFDAGDFIALVERYRCTHVAMVPLQYQLVLEHADFASVRVATLQSMCTVGSPMQPALKQQVVSEMGSGLIDLYGLTEGIITTLDPEALAGHTGSVGKPIVGTDLRIIDEDGQVLPTGESGEIVGWSRFVMSGYHGRPEATAEALWHDEQGRPWLRTGDVGKLDEDGYLYIVDRKKDMILSGGQNIYPADIEAVLATHPAVFDCGVIGIPHEKWGETPLGLVVLRSGETVSATALRDWTNERLGKQQRLARIEIRDELPRNPNGKLLKRELRKDYWP